jgi:hypothetical protein
MDETEQDMQQRIEVRAYQLWVEAGMPEGQAEDFWHLARAQVESEAQEDTDASRPDGQEALH